MSAGKSVRLFLADGTPGGLLTAEIMNWTGHVVAAPRSDFAALLNRQEVKRTGVYILIGDDPDSIGGVRAYIGEADEVRTRLYQHERNKDFWDRAIVLTSKDANLTKAHARYLESRFIGLGQAAGRSTLDNATQPPATSLPEADVSDMEYFITQAQIVLPVLGINLFRGKPATTQATQTSPAVHPVESPTFVLDVPKKGITASAQVVDGEFTVLAGSRVAPGVRSDMKYSAATARAYAGYEALHRKLRDDGSIAVEGTIGTTTRNIVFSSPSTAGSIVTGRSCNGRMQWMTTDGTTYGAWEDQGVTEEAP
ncbi:GIY-YIG nuclease family protein [Pseudactinotalea sp. HY158]|uniref:GIY-YIG nuclease family protein n=1 Tax=Pseudactinotalea sp. HY158 TaxID=2654547 RepID=UPI00129CC452|nr:GIY-YIG nuclease family protein [Pseudactinotalea sp. HY158]QGH68619.1 DUF4357 domain-containing protein [Pseudactinotalea sp. HY158]